MKEKSIFYHFEKALSHRSKKKKKNYFEGDRPALNQSCQFKLKFGTKTNLNM